MLDRNKVIKNLKWFRDRKSWREGIMIYDDHADVRKQICDNAIAMLEENEPVQPLYTTTSHPFHVGILYHCGNCHCLLNRDKDLFCSHCGKPIDWDKGAVKWE